MDVVINYIAVAVAALAAVGLGFLWYGPLFGKVWMKEMGWTKEEIAEGMRGKKKMMLSYAIQTAGSFVMAYVLAHFVALLGIVDTTMALQFSFWSWLGFVAVISLTSVLWEGKSWKYYAITTGYQLVNITLMVLILSMWQ